jgi:sucrose-6-phosphate hydrolase SacC (GH32 family)|tara:strand:- start:14301 stop:15836 length:1536 start_codon:yes stop_codon:yes gene_type:complete
VVLAKPDRARLVELVEAQREFRDVLLNDPYRPTYHFVNPEGRGMPFDPNGAIFWNSMYHLCYIYQNDDRIAEHAIGERNYDCWGHASSIDLLHWRFHKTALAPGDPDKSIFSGNCFINNKGEATMLYHAVGAGNCIATCSEPELENWTKLTSNPIVPIPEKGSLFSSWDPHGWTENGVHHAIFGGPTPALFKAQDLDDWEYVGPFMSRELPDVDTEHEDVSCPDFFELGDRHALLCISHERGARIYLGEWKNNQFHPEVHQRMNFPGGTCFAPESLLDDKGRRIMWAWVLDRNERLHITDFTNPPAYGWSGIMTLPRVLSLAGDGTLLIAPVEELERLRLRERRERNITVKDDRTVRLDGIEGNTLELALTIDPGDADALGLKVCASPDGKEQTLIEYNPSKGQLTVDLEKSSLDESIKHYSYTMFFRAGEENPIVTKQVAPLELGPGENLELRIFIDRSIIEIFANERQCITQRIYPTREDSTGIELFSKGSSMTVKSLQAWDMAPTNQW